jgi:hypothetical protein
VLSYIAFRAIMSHQACRGRVPQAAKFKPVSAQLLAPNADDILV